MNFLRNLLASILGTLFAFGILFVMFVILGSLIGGAEDSVSIKKNSILELHMEDPVSDFVGNA
ncbi:MAG: signal peptide peptidase SppA, partial [Flavobacteriales bacterium]